MTWFDFQEFNIIFSCLCGFCSFVRCIFRLYFIWNQYVSLWSNFRNSIFKDNESCKANSNSQCYIMHSHHKNIMTCCYPPHIHCTNLPHVHFRYISTFFYIRDTHNLIVLCKNLERVLSCKQTHVYRQKYCYCSFCAFFIEFVTQSSETVYCSNREQ